MSPKKKPQQPEDNVQFLRSRLGSDLSYLLVIHQATDHEKIARLHTSDMKVEIDDREVADNAFCSAYKPADAEQKELWKVLDRINKLFPEPLTVEDAFGDIMAVGHKAFRAEALLGDWDDSRTLFLVHHWRFSLLLPARQCIVIAEHQWSACRLRGQMCPQATLQQKQQRPWGSASQRILGRACWL